MSPRPDLLAVLPQLTAEHIHSWLPGLASAQGMVGRLDLAEVKRTGIRAPAVLVSRFGSKLFQTLAGPHHIYLTDMAAFIVTKDQPGLDRNAAAAAISQVLMTRLPDLNLSVEGVGEVSDLAEHSLDSAETKANGVALWAITWKQRLALTGLPEPEPISPALYVGQAPEIGAAHEDDYEQIGGAP